MMNTNDDDLDFMGPPERPKFLKVLCILTFICSGWIIMTNAFTYVTAKDMAAEIAKVKQEIILDHKGNQNKQEANFADRVVRALSEAMTEENIRNNALGILMAQLFCLGGAILMWRLKKIGFPFYVIGIALGIAVPFYLFGNNFIAVSASAFTGFFGAIFVVFYAMNLKAMVK